MEEFTAESLRRQLSFSMVTTLTKVHGLILPRSTPDFEAISDFLGERYRYWLDDIEHPNYGF